MAKLDEFALIRHLTDGRQSPERQREQGVVVGIGDDAAVVDGFGSGQQIVVSSDTMVEEVHFNPYTMRDADVGYKALASNVSDMAAMGAVPRYALVSLSVPKAYSPERISRLYDGLYECAERYGVAIIGGDTTSAPQHLVVTVTIFGTVAAGQALLRSAARHGDAVFLTGDLGCSAAGLHYMLQHRLPAEQVAAEAGAPIALIEAHRRPQPSVAAGKLLAGGGFGHALNDVSDGLASEAWEIAEASGIGIVLDESLIPVRADLQAYAEAAGVDPLEWILYGGEDYQLIGTMAPEDVDRVQLAFREQGLAFTVVGRADDSFAGVKLRTVQGELKPIGKKGYNHFE